MVVKSKKKISEQRVKSEQLERKQKKIIKIVTTG